MAPIFPHGNFIKELKEYEKGKSFSYNSFLKLPLYDMIPLYDSEEPGGCGRLVVKGSEVKD